MKTCQKNKTELYISTERGLLFKTVVYKTDVIKWS